MGDHTYINEPYRLYVKSRVPALKPESYGVFNNLSVDPERGLCGHENAALIQ